MAASNRTLIRTPGLSSARTRSYEARLAAFSILDLQARTRLGDLELRDTYHRHHDRIDDWGMVDRAAPPRHRRDPDRRTLRPAARARSLR